MLREEVLVNSFMMEIMEFCPEGENYLTARGSDTLDYYCFLKQPHGITYKSGKEYDEFKDYLISRLLVSEFGVPVSLETHYEDSQEISIRLWGVTSDLFSPIPSCIVKEKYENQKLGMNCLSFYDTW